MGYPDETAELDILRNATVVPEIQPALTELDIRRLLVYVDQIRATDDIMQMILGLVHKTRENAQIAQGASTRAMIDLLRAARARALFHQRDFVLPDDIAALAPQVLSHRIRLTARASSHPVELIEAMI